MARISEGKTSSPYPQLRCVYLVEAGTHAGVSVIAAPCGASEQCLARGLLPALHPGMLVLVDRGFISGALVEAIRARGAQVLGRLPQGIFPHKEQVLPDPRIAQRVSGRVNPLIWERKPQSIRRCNPLRKKKEQEREHKE